MIQQQENRVVYYICWQTCIKIYILIVFFKIRHSSQLLQGHATNTNLMLIMNKNIDWMNSIQKEKRT